MPKIDILDMFWNDGRAPNFDGFRAKNLRGVIHNATQGLAWVDPACKPREPLARAAGLLWGVCHTLDASDTEKQAAHFLSQIDFQNPVCVVVDFSAIGLDSPALHQLFAFCRTVDAASPPDYQIVIRGGDYIRQNFIDYSGGFRASDMRGIDFYFKQHRLWLIEPYSNQNPFPWDAVWMRRYVAPITDPVLGKIGHSYSGTVADLANNWTI